jgi:threonine dehydrogenase-like Zn-dependent dehydrogenase
MTGGRGPDACIDAIGMDGHGTGLQYPYDRVKQALRLHSDRGVALREAALACRTGGTLVILGVYGVMDKFPLEESPRGYEMFERKHDGCLRAASTP